MKHTLFTLGICIAGTAFAQQQQPDSMHLVLHENKNGTLRTLDTVVALNQQQSLFTWMEANGWHTPPPPPPPPGHGPAQFEHQIVIEGDSGALPNGDHRMMYINMEGDSMHGERPQMIMMRMEGDPGEMPPPPPGCRMMVIQDDGKGNPNGNGMMMRAPMPPPPPGSDVEVTVTEKDTVIDGQTRKMIIRTERIILPEEPAVPAVPPVPPVPPRGPVPPLPPQAPAQPGEPQSDKQPQPAEHQQQLMVYPNPSTSVINVEFDVNAGEKTILRVVDANGKVVYTEEIVEKEAKHVTRQINLGGKSKGAYTVEVKSDQKMLVSKVILQQVTSGGNSRRHLNPDSTEQSLTGTLSFAATT